MQRAYVYVDGENHFHRSDDHFKMTYPNYTLEELGNYSGWVVNRELLFVWNTNRINETVGLRRVYFTTYGGEVSRHDEHCEYIRKYGFEPHIIWEPKTKRKNRMSELEKYNIIEKAKGVDIALATRMVEDASKNLYDEVYLFTSDSDYLPVIRAVRAMGKKVYVFGFQGNVNNKQLKWVPDYFSGLEEWMDGLELPLKGPPIEATIEELLKQEDL